MTDTEGESMSITRELRDVADRIDAWFTRELQAKQEEIGALKSDNSGLQARLDVSMPLPLDADGYAWDSYEEEFIDPDGRRLMVGEDGTLDYSQENWFIRDSRGRLYATDACRHVERDIPRLKRLRDETIEDVRKSKDNLIAFLAQSGVMGWEDLNSFSSDFAKIFDSAYECGKRDFSDYEFIHAQIERAYAMGKRDGGDHD